MGFLAVESLESRTLLTQIPVFKVTVRVPAGQTDSTPSGEVFNGPSGFQVQPGKPAEFIYATETGTISAWAPNANPTKAIIKVNNSAAAADYTGLAMGTANNKT